MSLLQIDTANYVTTLTLNRPDSMNPLGAAGDGDAFVAACDAINADMDHLWTWVKTTTEASDEEIQRFWAFGMMQTMAIAMNAAKYLDSSDRARGMFILPSS